MKWLKIILGVLIVFMLILMFNSKTIINLEGFDKNEAIKYLIKNHINYEIIEEYSKEKIGTVIKQSYKEKTKINDINLIMITISKGINNKELYKEYQVNELGNVPIMMYHGIHNLSDNDTNYLSGNVDKEGYQRTKESFIKDLEFYYNNNYRMIRLIDYVNGRIETEIGKSPIILTFDDGLKNNINVLGLEDNGEIIIDPNSAVGILEQFKQKYPDYKVTATFFINGGIFGQPEYDEKILKWLVKNGYDIGNHSYTHTNLKQTTIKQTQEEIGKLYALLDSIIPNQYVNIVALPFGSPGSSSHINFPYILNGVYEDKYTTISTLKVGSTYDYSPFHNKFNKEFINRIRAYDNNGIDFDIKFNFDKLEKNRYISDGDVNTIVIKKSDKYFVKANLKVIEY